MDEILGLLYIGIPFDHFMMSAFALLVVILVGYVKVGKFPKRLVLWCLFVLYIYILLGATIIYRDNFYMSLNWVRKYELIPFESYHKAFAEQNYVILLENVLNIFLFVPFGLLLRLLFQRKYMMWIVFAAFVTSCTIEGLQFITHRGLCETDDMMHNTLGCIFGYSLCPLICKTVKQLRNE